MSISHIVIFHKNDSSSTNHANNVFELLEKEKFQCTHLEKLHTKNSPPVDLIIVLGGDGTFLRCVKIMHEMNVDAPVLGINSGRLGYLTCFEVNKHLHQDILDLLKKPLIIENRMLLDIELNKKHFLSLNELTLNRSCLDGMLESSIYIDQKYAFTQSGDGLIVATPTGSTAYSLSAGGPIVSPELNLILLVSVCPHSLTQRPLIVGENAQIQIQIKSQTGQISLDGQQAFDVKQDTITIQKSNKKLRLVKKNNYNNYQIMQKKLNWYT